MDMRNKDEKPMVEMPSMDLKQPIESGRVFVKTNKVSQNVPISGLGDVSWGFHTSALLEGGRQASLVEIDAHGQ